MTVKSPKVTASLLSAGVAASLTEQKLLFVGQMTATGTATSGALNENIGNDNSWDTLFGATSSLANAIRAARKINGITRFDAIALDDAAGTSATGAVTFTGTATEAGTITICGGSKNNHAWSVAVASGDNATTIGATLEAAITADTKSPISGSNAIGVVTTTAINKGTVGNTYGLASSGTVAGVTVAITAMGSGATDPTLTSVFDVVGDNRYQGVVWPYLATTALTDFLDPRFNSDNAVEDGVGFMSITDTLSNQLVTLGALNSESLSINCDKSEVTSTTYKGPAVFEIPFTKAAEFAAIRALRLTEDASIGSYVIARSGRDSFGGPGLASKPYANTPFPHLTLVDTGKGFTAVEADQLQAAGGWVIGNNRAGTEVIADEVVTTYKTDAAGNPDPTFTFLNYVDTSSVVREYIDANIRAKYAQFRLTGGALIRGRDSANSDEIAGYLAELHSTLGGPEFAAVQTGVGEINGTQVDFDREFRNNTTITLDLSAGKVTADVTVYIIVQARIFLIPISIAFSPEG